MAYSYAIGDRVKFLIDYVPVRDSRREPYKKGPHEKHMCPRKGQIGIIQNNEGIYPGFAYDFLVSFERGKPSEPLEWWFGFEHIEPVRFEMATPDFSLDEIEAGSKILEDLS